MQGKPSSPNVGTTPFADFAAFSDYLDNLGLFRMKPGLERMESMLQRLGLKRPPFVTVQVAGTNGKGSTCAMLENLARAHGLVTGLHSSPHFVSVRERIRINGRMLEEAQWTTLANRLMANGGEELSYFEFVTCLAVSAFADAGVDIAVMETGLGGSFDATSSLDADMVVFTPFDLDHQLVLGPTLKDIASDKAGCIRQGKPVVSAVQKPEAMREIERSAAACNAPLQYLAPDTFFPEAIASGALPLRLQGGHQLDNAKLALAVWLRLLAEEEFNPEQRKIIALARTKASDIDARALASAWLPGRMQALPPKAPDTEAPNPQAPAGASARISGEEPAPKVASFPCSSGWPHMLLDGAHNPHGLAALGLALARKGIAPAAVIFSCVADKDINMILPLLRSLATGPIFIPPIKDNPRAMSPEKLASLIGLNARPTASLHEALTLACELIAERLPETFSGKTSSNPLLICGSLYLLGEFYSIRPDALEDGV